MDMSRIIMNIKLFSPNCTKNKTFAVSFLPNKINLLVSSEGIEQRSKAVNTMLSLLSLISLLWLFCPCLEAKWVPGCSSCPATSRGLWPMTFDLGCCNHCHCQYLWSSVSPVVNRMWGGGQQMSHSGLRQRHVFDWETTSDVEGQTLYRVELR